MKKANPEELQALQDDLRRVRQDHRNVIDVDSNNRRFFKEPLDAMISAAGKLYNDVKEITQKGDVIR